LPADTSVHCPASGKVTVVQAMPFVLYAAYLPTLAFAVPLSIVNVITSPATLPSPPSPTPFIDIAISLAGLVPPNDVPGITMSSPWMVKRQAHLQHIQIQVGLQ
jgi:hypothetical protein